MPLDIVIDTREQSPWQFPPDLATVTQRTLRQGDYALDGDYSFVIERKSVADFIGTIGKGWDRLNREIDRMEMAGCHPLVMIVEGEISDLYSFSQTSMPVPFLMKRIADLTFRDVHVLFCQDPVHAAAVAYALFSKRYQTVTQDKSCP